MANPAVFRTQLRAVLRASAVGNVRLMYPMVSCVEELKASARILADVRSELDREGVAYDRNMKVGTMIEVPAAAVNADAFASLADFFSIGTNDLIQYTMAADRGNDAVASLYQPTNPAVLKLMRGVIAAAKRRGISVGVCGESAADPLVGVLWAAMGADHLSMSATYIPVISKLLSRLTRDDLNGYLGAITRHTSHLLDGNQAVVDLGYLGLEQTLKEHGTGTGEDDTRVIVLVLNLFHDGTDGLTLVVVV